MTMNTLADLEKHADEMIDSTHGRLADSPRSALTTLHRLHGYVKAHEEIGDWNVRHIYHKIEQACQRYDRALDDKIYGKVYVQAGGAFG
jgi:hypothetical protein